MGVKNIPPQKIKQSVRFQKSVFLFLPYILHRFVPHGMNTDRLSWVEVR